MWRGKLLSHARRATFIKSILAALPCYVMSSIKIPVTLCQQLDGILRKFLWQGHQNGSGFSLVPWRVDCNSKLIGGINIKKFQDLNLALLSNMGWLLAFQENQLQVKLLKAKYYPTSHFLHCGCKKASLWSWKGSLAARSLIKDNVCFRVGSRSLISVWDDPWVPFLPRF